MSEKKLSKKVNKKAVSPMIATVLLIMIVIVLAVIILLWSRGFIKEAITKEVAGSEKRVDEFCLEVVNNMKPIINQDKSFGFENTGNIPIYAFNLKIVEGGSSRIVKIDKRANPGFSVIAEGYSYPTDEDSSVKIIPILLGVSEKNDVKKEFACPEGQGLIV